MTKRPPIISVWVGELGAPKEPIKVGKRYILNFQADYLPDEEYDEPPQSSLSLVFISKKVRFNRFPKNRSTRLNTDERNWIYYAWSKVSFDKSGSREVARLLITPLFYGIAIIDVLFFAKGELQSELRLELVIEMLNNPYKKS